MNELSLNVMVLIGSNNTEKQGFENGWERNLTRQFEGLPNIKLKRL